MNPHKESWQQQVGIVPKRSKAYLARRFMSHRSKMFSGQSDRTKWERIGRPIFVEQPLHLFAVFNPYSTPKMRMAGVRGLFGLWTRNIDDE